MAIDAVVLAGGASSRMGSDKARLRVGGRSLLERAIAAAAGCGRIVVVGPRRRGVAEVHSWIEEDPPGCGPVHALAAGLGRVDAPWTLVLACDLPFVTPAVVSRLAASGRAHDGALVSDGERDNPLCGLYRSGSLRGAITSIGETRGASMAQLLASLDLARLIDGEAASDCDTPADVAAARRRVR